VAITPPSDIVLDVARAADPEKYRLAAERLARLRATADGPSPPAVADASTAMPRSLTNSPLVSGPASTSGGAQPRRRLDAYGQFESFVLQSFVQSMLPRNATTVFGKGSAGEFWKSMLAEKMGDELARSGQIGIARRLAAGAGHAVNPVATNTAGPLTPPPPLVNTLNGLQVPAPGQVRVVDPLASVTPDVGERS
jgi:hypothetical protein